MKIHAAAKKPIAFAAMAAVLVACGGDGSANAGSGSSKTAASTYTISDRITGLASGAQVTLLNNGSDALIINANGAFSFTTPVAANGGYAVTVNSQPAGQICSVSGDTGSGSGVTANIDNVGIVCSADTYTIGGNLTGLASGNQVTLLNNGANGLTLSEINAENPHFPADPISAFSARRPGSSGRSIFLEVRYKIPLRE